MTGKLIDNMERQIKELLVDLNILVRSAKERRRHVKGIIPYIGEFGELDYIIRKVVELRSLCSILILNRQKEDNNVKSE